MPAYRHIQLRGVGVASEDFSPNFGGNERDITPVTNRRQHARKLRGDLAQAFNRMDDIRSEQAEAGVPKAQRGVAMAVEGRVGEDLRLGEMKIGSRGLQLLSVHRATGNETRDRANMFVTEKSSESLLKALDKYEAWDERDSVGRRPQRFKLFESADEFRVAGLADLWTDVPEQLPLRGDEVREWEVWTRADAADLLLKIAERLELRPVSEGTSFGEIAVYNFVGSAAQIERLARRSAAVVELRGASTFVSNYLSLDPEGRAPAVQGILDRLTAAPAGSVRTTILDSGVNFANPLLALSLPATRCMSIEAARWGTLDHSGHGTHMAGVALYPDLAGIANSTSPVLLTTSLESVMVTAPDDAYPVPAHAAISRAVALAEGENARRVFCLAATAPGELDNGRPTSTSATLDKLAWNDGEATRLFCVAAGNVDISPLEPYKVASYADRNRDYRIQAPAQAVNALTVGAMTDGCSDDHDLLAPAGDLCPTSRTAQQWSDRYSHKPDIVMEGGNHIRDEDGVHSRATNETKILTTGSNVPAHPLAFTSDTSAATAAAAGLATRLLAAYPTTRAETLRGLMVHAAEWSPAMARRFAEIDGALHETRRRAQLIECYGWGTPDQQRLFTSAGDALTMIVEDQLRPFVFRDGAVRLNEMKYFKLPWPIEILRGLNQERVQLRCTLSYFAEPDPHGSARRRANRYLSHSLRFALKSPDDSDLQAQARINRLTDIDDDPIVGQGAGDRGWTLGSHGRSRGTLHHDIWNGPAHELARRDGVSVFPVKGWWADRKEVEICERDARFSLIVSIRTRSQAVDLVAEVVARIATANLVENVVEIRT